MASIGDRIRGLRKQKDLTQEQLGKIVNVGKSTISQYENEVNSPDAAMLDRLADVFGVSIDYLLGRTDDPRPRRAIELGKFLRLLRERNGLTVYQVEQSTGLPAEELAALEDGNGAIPSQQVLEKLAPLYNIAYEDLATIAGYTVKRPELGQAPEVATGPFVPLKRVPLLGTIRAGFPVLAEENIISWVSVPADTPIDFALTVRGDSMIGAGIIEGDLALCRQANTAEPGEMVVALVNGDDATVKYLIKDDDGWKLRAANPNYPDITLNEEGDRIQGVVVSIQKRAPRPETPQAIDWDMAIQEAMKHDLTPEMLTDMIRMLAKLREKK